MGSYVFERGHQHLFACEETAIFGKVKLYQDELKTEESLHCAILALQPVGVLSYAIVGNEETISLGTAW